MISNWVTEFNGHGQLRSRSKIECEYLYYNLLINIQDKYN